MSTVALLFVVAVGILNAEARTYDGYQVVRAIPNSKEQVYLLMKLKTHNDELDFWKVPVAAGHVVDINLSPQEYPRVTEYLHRHKIEYSVMIEDVQKHIDGIAPSKPTDLSSPAAFAYDKYNTLDDITTWVDGLAETYKDIASLVTVGSTYEGRTLKAVRIHKSTGNVTKPAFWMDGGIHSREWISPATVIYMLGHILEGANSDPKIIKMLDEMDFYVLPVFNADGYVYTHEHDRLWRKTREPNQGSSCVGTDPNRNWDWHWGESGASKNPCAEDFAGSAAFSQKSVREVAEYLKSIPDLKVYINFHSYSQLWMYPWAYAKEETPDNADLKASSIAAITALEEVHGTKYREGPIADIIYVASGSTADWTYGAASIKYSYGVELRDTGRHGFLLPATEIIPSGEETLAAILALAEYVHEHP